MFEKIIEAIRAHDTVIIHRHSNPDGDAIGSQTGLKYMILENFPGMRVFAVGDSPKRFSFIEGSEPDEIDDAEFSDALSIILDTSAKALISDDRYTLAKTSARIDHHIFCEKIADIEVTDTSYESCCGLIAAMAMECSLKLSAKAACALYTGMVTDSGRFRYDSTNEKTHLGAAFLISHGFDTNDIYRNLYADDFSFIRLRAEFTLKIKFTEHNVAYIYTTREELPTYGVDTFTVSRGMVGTMGEIRGVDIWVNFTETDAGVLAEIRSGKYNINPIATKYGGGGHAKASGATLPDREAAMQMLSDLDKMAEGENAE